MQTMSNIYRVIIALLIFCLSLTVADLALVMLKVPIDWMYGAGLLLTAPTAYRIVSVLDDADVGRWLGRGRKRGKDDNRLPRPIH